MQRQAVRVQVHPPSGLSTMLLQNFADLAQHTDGHMIPPAVLRLNFFEH